MTIEIKIEIVKVSGGFTIVAGTVSPKTGTMEVGMKGVATTPHSATVQARKLFKDLLEKIEPTIGKEMA